MKKLILIFILILVGCTSNYKTITPKEVYDNIDNENIIILDVRTEIEYNESHIENAINIPVDKISTIEYDKDKIIYVYCRSGNRSKKAVDILIDTGYNNVYDMGGLNNWQYELEGDN